jgi:hypothetical protein
VKIAHSIITGGVIAAALVAAGAGTASAAPAASAAPTPRIEAVYSGTDFVPLGDNDSSLSAYVYDGHLYVGGVVDAVQAPSAVKLVDGSGRTLCTDTGLDSYGGSFGFDCRLTVTDRTTSISAVSVVRGAQSAPSRPVIVTNYSAPETQGTAPAEAPTAEAATAPTAEAATAPTVAAPKVSLIERIGFSQISLLLQGQDAAGSEFAVTFDGQTQRVSASHGQAFTFVKGIKVGQSNVVTVRQIVGGVSSDATTYTYRIG